MPFSPSNAATTLLSALTLTLGPFADSAATAPAPAVILVWVPLSAPAHFLASTPLGYHDPFAGFKAGAGAISQRRAPSGFKDTTTSPVKIQTRTADCVFEKLQAEVN